MILELRSLDLVVKLMGRVGVCLSGNYVLCDRSGGVLDVELTSDGPELLDQPLDGCCVHANHFLCAAHATADNHAQSLPDSFRRQERMTELVAQRLGRLTVDDFKEILGDHEGHPSSICRHAHDGPHHPMLNPHGQTVAAIIAEPAQGRLHVSRGNPCENPFVEYSMP